MGLTANQLRGRVPALIDGEEKFLRFDQGGLAQMIEALNLEGLVSIPSAVANLDPKTLNVLVWAGRLWEEPDLKLEEVSKQFFALMPTYTAAVEAINLSLWGTPEPDIGGSEDDADPPMDPADGTSGRPEHLQ